MNVKQIIKFQIVMYYIVVFIDGQNYKMVGTWLIKDI